MHPVLLLDGWQIALYVVVALLSVIALALMVWLILRFGWQIALVALLPVIALALMAGLILQFGWQIALYVVMILVALFSVIALLLIVVMAWEVRALVRQL